MAALREEDFQDIYNEIKKTPIPKNAYRGNIGATKATPQRSQCHGLVRKRSLPMSLSRQSWIYPRLYRALLEFGRMHCPIPFTSIQINYNTVSQPHKDKHNVGATWIVALGDYEGGELAIYHLGEPERLVNIRYHPFLFNGSATTHASKPFAGERISLVYHSQEQTVFPGNHSLDDYTFDAEGYVIWQGRRLTKDNGLPHPLQVRLRINNTQE
jgi:hypothetical protein